MFYGEWNNKDDDPNLSAKAIELNSLAQRSDTNLAPNSETDLATISTANSAVNLTTNPRSRVKLQTQGN